MLDRWQDDYQPEVRVVPPSQRPALTPAMHTRLLALPGGAGDLWIHLWLLADRAGCIKTTELQIAERLGRTTRWVAKAVQTLKRSGLLAGGYGNWKICSVEQTDDERSFNQVEQTFNEDERTFNADPERTFEKSLNERSGLRTLPPHTPPTRTHERENVTPPYSPPTADGFEDFYRRYPGHRRGARNLAFNAWVQGDCASMTEAIGAGLDRWLTSEDWEEEGGKYIPNCHKWLAEQRWLREPRKQASRWYFDEKGIERDRLTGNIRTKL